MRDGRGELSLEVPQNGLGGVAGNEVQAYSAARAPPFYFKAGFSIVLFIFHLPPHRREPYSRPAEEVQ